MRDNFPSGDIMIKFTLNANKAMQTLLWILNKKPNINKKVTKFKVSVGSSNFEEVNNALSTALDGLLVIR